MPSDLPSNLLRDGGFDQLDLAILEALQANGRISVADLARSIHLSQPAVHNRIKRLERAGVITAYVALLDRDAAGYNLLCFIGLTLRPHTQAQFEAVQDALSAQDCVLECYRVSGAQDLMLKVALADHKALDDFVMTHLSTLPGIERIETHMVLHEVKQTTRLPLKKR